MSQYEFSVTIEKGKATAEVSDMQREDFNDSPNPRKFLAEIELWIEDEAEEVRCPFCTHPVKLVRIAVPLPNQPVGQPGQPQNFGQLIQQLQQQQNQTSGPFQMGNMSPTFGQNRANTQAVFDARFTDQELTDMLTDVDLPPQSGATRADLLQAVMDWFYDV